MSLQRKLDEMKRQAQEKLPTESLSQVLTAIEGLHKLGIVDNLTKQQASRHHL